MQGLPNELKKESSKKSYSVTKCRYCKTSSLLKFLSLGKQPLSNSFIHPNQIPFEKSYPLDLVVCESCFLVQIGEVVSPKIIFDNYLYLSSSSLALKNHYKLFTQYLTDRFLLKKGDVAVDIGCNDGILLHGYGRNITCIGVEPSKVAAFARLSGLNVIKAFFNQKIATKILNTYGHAKVTTATNVFAHVDDIDEFIKGVTTLIAEDGIFVIEVPYLLDMIQNTFFDTIYHEHLSYISLTPLAPFLLKYGLEVFDIERLKFGASGPALRIFIGKTKKHEINSSVTDTINCEQKWGIKQYKTYFQFDKRVKAIKKKMLDYIGRINSSGSGLGGYGASAKGNTLLNYFEITPSLIKSIADTNPLKIGLLTPGSHIPIVTEKEFLRKMPEYALLLTWNYLDFFLEKSQYFKRGGKFLVTFPSPRIVQ